MARYLITGDGWAQGEFSRTAFRIPEHIEDTSPHRFWRTSTNHGGVGQYMREALPQADIFIGGGYGHNNDQSIKEATHFVDWHGAKQTTGVIMFWSSPEKDYNPFNLSSQNWHGIPKEHVDTEVYYIKPTNRWENVDWATFKRSMWDLVNKRLRDLNQLGVPVYLIGGSCALPDSNMLLPYENIVPVIHFSGELWCPELLSNLGYMDFIHENILRAYKLYGNTNLNPVHGEIIAELSMHTNPLSFDTFDTVNKEGLYSEYYSADYGNRKLHKLIWDKIQSCL